MTKLYISWCVLLAAGCIGCEACSGPTTERSPAREPSSSRSPGSYHSDYFVFVSEKASPLRIVPIDVNWRQTAHGRLSTELKAWLGSSTRWPMRYETGKVSVQRAVPEEWFRVPTPSAFRFFDQGHRIEADVDGRQVRLDLPKTFGEAATRETFAGGTIVTQVAQAELHVDGEMVGGNVLHEQVRLPAGADVSFGRFQYFVVQGCDGFYVIKDRGERGRHASRFRPTHDLVEETGDFHFSERGHTSDERANRDEVPTAWRIRVPAWNRAFELETIAGHTGYGPAELDPRPLYRQATVRGRDDRDCTVHGMAELVLEG